MKKEKWAKYLSDAKAVENIIGLPPKVLTYVGNVIEERVIMKF